MDSLILAKDLQEAFRDYIANGAISLGSLFFSVHRRAIHSYFLLFLSLK